uniref:Uncharacterized protein n=1 Tax=Myoviridae sp. ctwwN25 TaxID=2825209 RepID=A0A8S5PNB7_9CAUD|nr:MAG TPA: hypothetical protein [Myoviridae sp. ctwwN25]
MILSTVTTSRSKMRYRRGKSSPVLFIRIVYYIFSI